jgi:hypothetical protein
MVSDLPVHCWAIRRYLCERSAGGNVGDVPVHMLSATSAR